MAYGDGVDDAALQSAWNDFCERLRTAGELAFKDVNPGSPLERADAFRFLTQNLGQAFDLALETRDTRHPMMHAFCTPLRKLGADSADFAYHQAWIDGQCEYRISGVAGTARFFNIAVQGPRPEFRPGTQLRSLHEPFGDTPETNLFGHQISVDSDGTFELYVGGDRRSQNWLPTTPGSRKLFIRQGFDRWDEEPWTLRIERVDMDDPRPMPTPTEMIEAFEWAGNFVTGLMADWPDSQIATGAIDVAHPNTVRAADSAGDPRRGRTVELMAWELHDDQALILELGQTEAFWMVCLGGVFMNSFDYLYRPVSYTPSRAAVDADGTVRFVLCGDDPGYANWLDTQGFTRGTLAIRTILADRGPELQTRLVAREELDSVLPADSPRASPSERRDRMRERFRAIQRQRFGV